MNNINNFVFSLPVTFWETRRILRRVDVLDLLVVTVCVDDIDWLEAAELHRVVLAFTIEVIESLMLRPVVKSKRCTVCIALLSDSSPTTKIQGEFSVEESSLLKWVKLNYTVLIQ